MRLADRYADREIADDFLHVRQHFQRDDAQRFVCGEMQRRYPCKQWHLKGDLLHKDKRELVEILESYEQPTNGSNSDLIDRIIAYDKENACCTAKRHKARQHSDEWKAVPELIRVQSSHSDYNEEDLVHSQMCDQIHCYFMHSTVGQGQHPVVKARGSGDGRNDQNEQPSDNNRDDGDEQANDSKEHDDGDDDDKNADDDEYLCLYNGAEEGMCLIQSKGVCASFLV